MHILVYHLSQFSMIMAVITFVMALYFAFKFARYRTQPVGRVFRARFLGAMVVCLGIWLACIAFDLVAQHL